MSADDELLSPWHYLVVPTDAYEELPHDNLAVSLLLSRYDSSWEGLLGELVRQGATDAEIWAGDWLRFLPIFARRRLEAMLAGIRGAPARDVAATAAGILTRDEVLRTQAQLRAAGQPYGQKALAKALHTSQATIRRRLAAK